MIFADWLIVSAFIAGLIGSVHCVGMCGGIVGALSLSSAAKTRSIPIQSQLTASARSDRRLPLAYNAGRIASYSIAGALAGLLGAGLFDGTQVARIGSVGSIVAGLFMIALGLYLAAWWRGLAVLENLGAKLWRRIEPYGRALIPPRNAKQGFALGMIWGWLPCGMVYTALAGALASGETARGALAMLAFGVGTLPMLLGLSFGARSAWLANLRRGHSRWRAAIGLAFIVLGAYGILAPTTHVHGVAPVHTVHGHS